MVIKSGNAELFLYADDLKVYNEINTEDDGKSLLDNIDVLYEWSQYLILKFQPDKCVSTSIRTKKKQAPIKPYYNMNGARLKVVKQEKDLGIIIDSDLNFEEHIAMIVIKANSIIGMI